MTIEQWDALLVIFRPRLEALARRVYRGLRASSLRVDEPYENDCDTYSWNVTVHPPGRNPDDHGYDNDIEVGFELVDAVEYDGEENGLNFSCNIVEWGGRIVGGFTPFNYTPAVWVPADDPTRIEERWELFETNIESRAIADLIKQFWRANVRHTQRS